MTYPSWVPSWFRNFSLAAKGIFFTVAFLVGWLLLSAVSSTVAGWNDSFEAWVWARRNAKIAEQVTVEQQKRAVSEQAYRDLQVQDAEIRGKYSISLETIQKLSAKGATQDEIDAELEKNLQRVRESELPVPVPDREFLEYLRKKQTAKAE